MCFCSTCVAGSSSDFKALPTTLIATRSAASHTEPIGVAASVRPTPRGPHLRGSPAPWRAAPMGGVDAPPRPRWSRASDLPDRTADGRALDAECRWATRATTDRRTQAGIARGAAGRSDSVSTRPAILHAQHEWPAPSDWPRPRVHKCAKGVPRLPCD